MRTNDRFLAPVLARAFAVAVLMPLLISGCATVTREGPEAREEVVFFPSPVSVSGNGQWSLTVQGRISEPAGHVREDLIAPFLVTPGDIEQRKILHERARLFLSNSSRNREVSVKIGDEVVLLPASSSAGYFTAEVQLTDEKVAQLAKAGIIPLESLPTATNPKRFPGLAMLVPEEGVIVVSDVDDTIKITNIRDPREKVTNTFLTEFRPVPGMGQLYSSWKEAFGPRIHFHIVSAGPWQLHEPLRQLTERQGFPDFTWTMRPVDIGNPIAAIEALTASPKDFKVREISNLMKRFPKRHVVLVGDSGEQDPEAYAAIMEKFKDRVDAVYIRNVSREDRHAGRYAKIFTEGADAKLCVFLHPEQLPPLTPSTIGTGFRDTQACSGSEPELRAGEAAGTT